MSYLQRECSTCANKLGQNFIESDLKLDTDKFIQPNYVHSPHKVTFSSIKGAQWWLW